MARATKPGDLHGPHVRLRVHTTTKDVTTLANTVFRNQFYRPDGTRVRLRGIERAALLHLLSFSWDRADNPEWRLDMKKFVADFAEGRSTVYGALRRLEVEGFLLRRRVNDPEDGGLFTWYWDATDRPGTLDDIEPQTRAGGMQPGMKPQVTPCAKKPNVDVVEAGNPRSEVVYPRSENPDMDEPNMAELDAVTSYREGSYLPTFLGSLTLVDAREGGRGEGGPQPENDRPMASPPPAVKGTVRTRLPAEIDRTPTQPWLEFTAQLPHHPAVQGHLMPNRGDQELIALRCQLAHDTCGWTEDELSRLLLADLRNSQSVAGVWLHRLHPDNLPVRARRIAPPVTAMPRHRDRSSLDAAVSAKRIAEIRDAAGIQRGERWRGLMTMAVAGAG